MITLPGDIEVPTYNLCGKSSKKLIVNMFEKRTYLKIMDLDGKSVYCEVYFADLERAWNKTRQQ